MEKKQKCDKCHEIFIRKFVAVSNSWSRLNEVNYWTDNKGWKKYKILCRGCLKDWRENYTDDFLELVSQKKKGRFRAYLYNGLLDRKDLVTEVRG